jgi:dihydroorotate dehydrogenase
VVGINLGRGRDTAEEEATADYLAAHRLVAPVADYLVVNVSSPNTPGLRDLQRPDRLTSLVGQLSAAGERLDCRRPLLVKLAPDLDDAAFDELVGAVAGSAASGLILTNTTLSRDGLSSPMAHEAGGLSGAPLRERALAMVARARRLAGEGLTIVASGGLATAADVAAARDAGADLVQLWTGLVYRGPGLIGEAAAVPWPGSAQTG